MGATTEAPTRRSRAAGISIRNTATLAEIPSIVRWEITGAPIQTGRPLSFELGIGGAARIRTGVEVLQISSGSQSCRFVFPSGRCKTTAVGISHYATRAARNESVK